jgi:crotonobetainyl-CoA:carnitine CoA-transferase CaiB-like acyl-CoA transferase
MEAIAPVHMLDGYKVLDFTQAVAGPTATLMLAEMRAEVIKVELMPNGDLTRAIPLIKNGRSGYFVQHNRGKKSICVDVKHPEGLALIKGLIPQVDVLMENFAPGVIGRLGLDYETVKALNPRIVMCSLSAFGQTGPLANEPGFDTLGAAYAGITSMGGEADGPASGHRRRQHRRSRRAGDLRGLALSRTHRPRPVPRRFAPGYLFPLP